MWVVLDQRRRPDQPHKGSMLLHVGERRLRLVAGKPLDVEDALGSWLVDRYADVRMVRDPNTPEPEPFLNVGEVRDPALRSSAPPPVLSEGTVEVTVTETVEVEGEGDENELEAIAKDPERHEFRPDRGGVNCLLCEGKAPGHMGYEEAAESEPKASGAITASDLSKGGRKGRRSQ